MKIKKNYIIAIFFLAFIFVFMISVFVRTFSVKGEKNIVTFIREEDFDNNADNIWWGDGKFQWLEFNGFISKICGVKIYFSEHRISCDDTAAEIKDGWLTYVYDYYDTSEQAKQLIKFNDFLKERSIDCVTLLMPFKIDSTDTSLIETLNDNANKITDEFIKNVSGETDVYDMRNISGRHGVDYLDMFFKTDHHWKPETGLEFTAKTAEYLNKNYGFDMDVSVYDKENFNINVLENYYLGSLGCKVTLGYARPENLSIITPKADTDFSLYIFDQDKNIRGNFEEAFMDKCQLVNANTDKELYYNTSPYNMYMYGNKTYIHVENHLTDSKKRILVLKDSFANVMTPFLAMQTQEMDIIDLRGYKGIRLFIQQTNPDMVLIICQAPSILDKRLFQFE